MNKIYMVQFAASPSLTIYSRELLAYGLSRKSLHENTWIEEKDKSSQMYAQIIILTRAGEFSGVNFVLSPAEKAISVSSWKDALMT
jgi:hypothetical protein